MIAFTPEARAQIRVLNRFYSIKHRSQAVQNLKTALLQASLAILEAPAAGLPHPRPYPTLDTPGLL